MGFFIFILERRIESHLMLADFWCKHEIPITQFYNNLTSYETNNWTFYTPRITNNLNGIIAYTRFHSKGQTIFIRQIFRLKSDPSFEPPQAFIKFRGALKSGERFFEIELGYRTFTFVGQKTESISYLTLILTFHFSDFNSAKSPISNTEEGGGYVVRLSSVLLHEGSGRERMDYNSACNLIALY